ncbi:MAG: carbon monoxide dehydrogenase [Nitrospirae bacterium]|nr:carbon monoxide dehydrogenase [Nitrospirota bacterium]
MRDEQEERYRVLPGPEGFLPPAAAMMGVTLPDPGQSLLEGRIVPEAEALEHAARKLLSAKVPTIHPGPLTLWHWSETAAKEATAVKALADAIPARIIPMADYRPKYPKINAAVEINPNHPNLTIWHNKEDVCLFVGVHCHQSNMALKIIRGGTSCYTIAICAYAGDEEASVTFRDAGPDMVWRLVEWVKKLKAGGVKSQALPYTQFSMTSPKRNLKPKGSNGE